MNIPPMTGASTMMSNIKAMHQANAPFFVYFAPFFPKRLHLKKMNASLKNSETGNEDESSANVKLNGVSFVDISDDPLTSCRSVFVSARRVQSLSHQPRTLLLYCWK
jgi:hypothetical protein